MLIDSHCHLDFPDFADERDAIIARARQAGVGLMLTISTRLDQFDRVLAVAEAYPDVYCTVGIHPHEASDHVDVDAAKLVALTRHPKVVGIGETGLDYYYEHSDRESQKHCFLAHIAAARETGLPVVIHTRDADEDMAAIIEAEMGKGRFKGLLHCFSSGHALAELAVRHGMMVSFSGILTFNKARDVQESARALPMENLLVETDAPYLAPVPLRGKRNEPSYVAHTAAFLARLKGVSTAEITERTTENFLRLFDKVPRDAVTERHAA
ncbi:MAG TPA: TatD family hydrolase [Ferrovibrio sp.]|uniref:TatD family hydrolase n=1 Tax=Ferrovibrio sp. TaxID=1917215 RepID=UPI002B4B2417|nr:TatD family hydrolase [Ferrovibrio sp.]HLT77215.1 TatD family hydrolase [Ferrovibrio sp.]